VTGHVSGVPVEEVLPALMSGSGAVLILLTSLGTRLQSSRLDRQPRNEVEEA
jgi:hypothetical protein